jgi:hypothetical protein
MSNGWLELIVLCLALVALCVALVYGFARWLTRGEDQRGFYGDALDREFPRESVRNVTPDPLDPRRAGWWPKEDA